MLISALVTAATIYFLTSTIWSILRIYDYLARMGRDATDPARGRSGLLLYTDAETDVQYVGTVFGGLVRRVTCPDGVSINRPFAPANRTWADISPPAKTSPR